MRRTVLLAIAAAGALMTAPAAIAQTSGSSGPKFNAGSQLGSDGRVFLNLDQIPNGDQRRDPGQRPTELMATSLLNNFSGYGFTAVRNFHKAGSNYMAEVQARDGRWMTVEIDPSAGTLSSVR